MEQAQTKIEEISVDMETLPEPMLTDIAKNILARRYLIKDETGEPVETPKELFWRVASYVASADKKFGATDDEVLALARSFYYMMSQGYWLPNTPTLVNAGRPLGQLAACFVLPVEDSLSNSKDGIYDTLTAMAKIHQGGGGTGFSFSRLRPAGSMVKSTTGVASGPVSFMSLYDTSTDVVRQGGVRRGANMGILRVDHPDILEFIDCKQDTSKITNFNISVAITNAFMEALSDDPAKEADDYDLIWDGEVVGQLNAGEVWHKICENAWRTGEPGIYFVDEANYWNPVPHLGSYEATNPCWSGDTLVWTAHGPRRFDELAETESDIPVLTQSENGQLTVRMMRRPHCNGVKEVVRVTLDDGSVLHCTETHGIYLRNGERVDAQDLKPGDSIASVYRHKANSKGYMRLWNGIESPSEHHVMVGWAEGRRPDYPAEHCHHKNGVKDDNRPENLEILPAKEHNGLNMWGEDNPMYGIWDERNPLFGSNVSVENNPRYRDDINDHEIAELRENGWSYSAIADVMGCSKYTVQKRMGYERPVNHKVVSVEHTGERVPVYNGAVDDTERYFVMCGKNDAILSANCAEQPLLPYDVCNLGSLNLSKFVDDDSVFDMGDGDADLQINWEKFEYIVGLSMRFLDNVIELNNYPLPEIEERAKAIRRVGNGVMGFADMLVKLGEPYGSDRSLMIAGILAKRFVAMCKDQSEELAEERGVFPEWEHSIHGPNETCARDSEGARVAVHRKQRHCNVTTVAPTGSISIIAGCSGGIEPLYGVSFIRNQAGATMIDTNEEFLRDLEDIMDTPENAQKIAKIVAEKGSVQIPEVPVILRKIYQTADTVKPSKHIAMQSVWQSAICSGISKTINLPKEATVQDVRDAFMQAWQGNCKGVTVYRDGSRPDQVLSTAKTKENDVEHDDAVRRGSDQERASRPARLGGETRKIMSPVGEMFVTVNRDSGGSPYEVFVTIGKAGGTAQSFGEAVGRLASLCLRKGIGVEDIYKQLRGISSDRAVGFGQNKVRSGPDAVAIVLADYMDEAVEPSPEEDGVEFAGCPECGSALHFSEGCYSCHACGYSGCA